MSDPSEPIPDSVTGTAKMTIGGYTLEVTMTVPTQPVTLRFMLPVVNSLADAVVNVAVQAAEGRGEHISCKKGCGACCRQLVPLAEVEAPRIRELVDNLPEPRRTEIRARFAEARRRLEANGIWDRLSQRGPLDAGGGLQMGREYFFQGIPCPFLEEESCSIHPDRPLSCREFLVTSPAEECARLNATAIKKVPMPRGMLAAVAAFDEMPKDAKQLRWGVPLIMALDWTEENPQDVPKRTGPEWMGELFEHLREKKTSETT
jgi:Fe-S-cluster containining protein